jgi:hypothetical protein
MTGISLPLSIVYETRARVRVEGVISVRQAGDAISEVAVVRLSGLADGLRTKERY